MHLMDNEWEVFRSPSKLSSPPLQSSNVFFIKSDGFHLHSQPRYLPHVRGKQPYAPIHCLHTYIHTQVTSSTSITRIQSTFFSKLYGFRNQLSIVPKMFNGEFVFDAHIGVSSLPPLVTCGFWTNLFILDNKSLQGPLHDVMTIGCQKHASIINALVCGPKAPYPQHAQALKNVIGLPWTSNSKVTWVHQLCCMQYNNNNNHSYICVCVCSPYNHVGFPTFVLFPTHGMRIFLLLIPCPRCLSCDPQSQSLLN